MAFMRNVGIQSLVKEGMSFNNDPLQQAIESCKELGGLVQSSVGPNGARKMVINHLQKQFTTKKGTVIITEAEIQHPCAKLLADAAKSAHAETGDGTKSVLLFGAELLKQAQLLLRDGLKGPDIVVAYKDALAYALSTLSDLTTRTVTDVKDTSQVKDAVKYAMNSCMEGYADALSDLVIQACVHVCPKNPASFNVDNVRVVKVAGASILDSFVIHGIALLGNVEGTIHSVKNPVKVAVYNCAIDNASLEAKGVALVNNAQELTELSKSEEKSMNACIERIARAGVNVIVSSQSFGDTALHFIEKYKMMAVKVISKHQLRRLCSAVNAQQLLSLDPPTTEEVGSCSLAEVRTVADQKVIVFENNDESSKVSTIVVRGATNTITDDVERALDDGVNTYRTLGKDGRLVLGNGEFEHLLAAKVREHGRTKSGLDQYGWDKFGTAIVEYNKSKDDKPTGSDVEPAAVKEWVLRLATETATTILSVNNLIMAKQAGGPKPRKGGDDDD